MSRPTKNDKVCSIFRCPKLKNNVCCYNCKRYDDCEIKCLNAPYKCGMYIKPTRGGYEP